MEPEREHFSSPDRVLKSTFHSAARSIFPDTAMSSISAGMAGS
jgi:hypothetical protein